MKKNFFSEAMQGPVTRCKMRLFCEIISLNEFENTTHGHVHDLSDIIGVKSLIVDKNIKLIKKILTVKNF